MKSGEEAQIKIAIIGGGVIGLAVAYELAKKFGPDYVYLFERNSRLGEEQSGRNSGVIHSGIYYEPGSLKARFCPPGNVMLKEFCRKYEIPHSSNGKLIVAITPEDESVLEFYFQRAKEHGIGGVKIIPQQQIADFEPNIRGRSALVVPTSGVVDAATYLKTLERLAINEGVTIIKRTKITDIEPTSAGAWLTAEQNGEKQTFMAERVINAAGLYGDVVARMINPESPYTIQPLRGEYCTFNMRRRPELYLRGMNVYSTPKYAERDGKKYFSVGIHLTPTFDLVGQEKLPGNTALVGPTADPIDVPNDYSSKQHNPQYFLEAIRPMLPGLQLDDLQLGYSGIRAKLKTPKDDFVLARDPEYPMCINALADSPGLTSSLAIAKYLSNEFF